MVKFSPHHSLHFNSSVCINCRQTVSFQREIILVELTGVKLRAPAAAAASSSLLSFALMAVHRHEPFSPMKVHLAFLAHFHY